MQILSLCRDTKAGLRSVHPRRLEWQWPSDCIVIFWSDRVDVVLRMRWGHYGERWPLNPAAPGSSGNLQVKGAAVEPFVYLLVRFGLWHHINSISLFTFYLQFKQMLSDFKPALDSMVTRRVLFVLAELKFTGKRRKKPGIVINRSMLLFEVNSGAWELKPYCK